MANTNAPEIRIDISAGKTPEEHYKWNIESAAQALLRRPDEMEITMAVYRCHRSALKNKGISEDRLVKGDEELLARVNQLVDETNRRATYPSN
ncbi:hypothetical protein J4233_04325 [Candidatus Pacearchaeota archaeon]|nr:hypothetical protein [Candidatus Pacearchaeota archaeon]